MVTHKQLRLLLTACAFVVALVHLLAPSVRIDFVTLVLLTVAALPWLAPLIKSVELPGGFKIELREIKAATDAVLAPVVASGGLQGQAIATANGEVIRPARPTEEPLREVGAGDPNLALVAFRIEIEKRLRELAKKRGIQVPPGASALLRDLRDRNWLPDSVAAALADLIALGNQAAHGRPVDSRAAAWVFDEGPKVLLALDELMQQDG